MIQYSLCPIVPERQYRDSLHEAKVIPESKVSFESHANNRICAESVVPHSFYLNATWCPSFALYAEASHTLGIYWNIAKLAYVINKVNW